MIVRSSMADGQPPKADGRPPKAGVLIDQPARDLIRHALDETLVVEAAAGTGKTTELVARIVNTLAEGRARIGEVVAVTFTEKAAGELKLRLREEIEHARAGSDGIHRDRLEDALAHLEDAHVSTIHGFCADLLRERPVEADVDPRFDVLLEPAAATLRDQVVDAWLQETLDQPPEGVRRVLRRTFRREEGEQGPKDALRQAARALADWRDFATPWRRDPLDRAQLVADTMQAIHECAALTGRPASTRDNLYQDTEPIRRFSRTLVHALDATRRDDDGLEALLVSFSRDKTFMRCRAGSGQWYASGVARADVRAAHSSLRERLESCATRLDADLAALLHAELQPCLVRYDAAKQERGALDFTDLLIRVRDLLRRDAQVRADFQRRYRRLFVDEFQDTDPIQAEILLLLASNDPAISDWTAVHPIPGKLFIVGDPKQAIYRFRRADVETYWSVRERLMKAGAIACQLRSCFRSVPALQRAINHAFAPVMDGDRASAQASYVALEPVRSDEPAQPALIALPVPKPYATRNVSGAAIEKSLPDAVGAFVDWLVTRSGWTVSERAPGGGERCVSVQARHVAILFRRFVSYGDDVTRAYVQSLEARHVPHLLVGGRSFHAREEVDTLRAALNAIEWPDDELSVYATLRGSLFAFADHQLLSYRDAHDGRLNPFAAPENSSDVDHGEIADALRLIASLHRRRNRVPVQDTLHVLLRATRAHAGLVLRPGGEQALANVLHIVELARQYEASDGASFRGFVRQLQDERYTEASETPILEEGTDGVRIMTVHKAKGLEFPVVILADMTCQLGGRHAARALNAATGLCVQRLAGCAPVELLEQQDAEAARERAEGHRLAYVAATRARDLLVVPAVGDERYPDDKQGERWVGVLNDALYPAKPYQDPHVAPGCPPFGRDSVVERPDDGAMRGPPVRPGLYMSGSPDAPFGVTWWDPYALHLDATLTFGRRQKALIDRGAPASRVEEGIQAVDRWTQAHETRLMHGAMPSLRLQRVTDAARMATADIGNVVIERVDRSGVRPGGRAFGALVHEVLAAVPLDASEAAISAAAGFKARLLGVGEESQAAATALVMRVLQHPWMRVAADAAREGRCRRETSVTLRLEDGTRVEGQLDLAFETADGWTVVDFKTDSDLSESIELYSRQVALYARAVAEATGKPTRAVLLQL